MRYSKEIVLLLNSELKKILAFQNIRERFATQAVEAMPSTPEELGRAFGRVELWARVIEGGRHPTRMVISK